MVHEVEEFGRLEAMAERYRRVYGVAPLNVSHWDASRDTADALLPALQFEEPFSGLDYVFSYTLDQHRALLTRLGFDPVTHGCLITPSGTASMLCALHWLRSMGASQLTALGPFYFPVVHQAKLCGLRLDRQYMVRTDRAYTLPPSAVLEGRALWVTAPVYCTGVALGSRDQEELTRLLRLGSTIVLDECLAQTGMEVGPRLPMSERLVALYAPQKSLCVNGLKFSMIVFDRVYQGFFDSWADVLYGPLGLSTVAAANHYLSASFSAFDSALRVRLDATKAFVRDTLAGSASVEQDPCTTGHFMTLYFPAIDASVGSNEDFMWRLTSSTAGVVIPGTRNHFDQRLGFCFRVNLALDSSQFRATLVRLIAYLSSACEGADGAARRG
jgi:hypothetical protein